MPLHIIPTRSTTIAWLLFAVGSVAADNDVAVSGRAVGGIRLRLEHRAAKKSERLRSHFKVVLENVSDRDLNVNLGFSLANGKSHHPMALSLVARTKANKTLKLIYAGVPGVAGRVDPFIVPLPSGSSYTLPCKLEDYADSRTGGRIDFTAESFRVAVELTGKTESDSDSDRKGLPLVPCWQGTVRSNEVLVSFDQ